MPPVLVPPVPPVCEVLTFVEEPEEPDELELDELLDPPLLELLEPPDAMLVAAVLWLSMPERSTRLPDGVKPVIVIPSRA